MRDRTPVQIGALVVGIVFLAVGILGFIPGITTNFDDITFIGHESDAKLLGLFQVNVVHNIVHLLFGVAGIALASTAGRAWAYLVVGGVLYLLLWIFGLVIPKDEAINFISLNTADNWLHLFLGVGMLGLGLVLGRDYAGERLKADERRV